MWPFIKARELCWFTAEAMLYLIILELGYFGSQCVVFTDNSLFIQKHMVWLAKENKTFKM